MEGFVGSSSGKILVGGYDIKTCTRDARESIGYCPQDNILFDELTVEEHVMFFAIVKGIPRDRARNEVVTVLYDSGLADHRSKKVMDLSLGLQRCLCTVMAIVGTPKVIILDEPTANVDPDARRDLWEMLMKLRRGCSVFLTTQHLDEAGVLGDRIAVMSSGRIRCVGSPAFLKQRFGTGYHLVVNKLPEVRYCEGQKISAEACPQDKAPK
ncbi:hypothetical protein HPB48_007792 [Haemaphysalis longicornis]|uniref:ABC transporter domain-containing protein n=1 Tax=Haemaphysalis longicornis TaxID=44386 RepID=A0A9J6G9H5_HAELO|nr:hypothetical protein HPB48_007792 [Haemaphysalis longicornis]